MSSPTDGPTAPAPSATRAALLSFVLVGAANLASEVVLYGRWLVPRFGVLEAVPFGYLLLLYLPVLLACALVGTRLRTGREILAAGLAAGGVASLTKWLLAAVHAPGHEASLATRDPERFFGLHVGRITLGFVVLMAVVAQLASMYRLRSRGKGPT